VWGKFAFPTPAILSCNKNEFSSVWRGLRDGKCVTLQVKSQPDVGYSLFRGAPHPIFKSP
jgi:hypothetical protein